MNGLKGTMTIFFIFVGLIVVIDSFKTGRWAFQRGIVSKTLHSSAGIKTCLSTQVVARSRALSLSAQQRRRPLDQAPGSKSLSASETKTREQFQKVKAPKVTRLHSSESRSTLESLAIGQKFRGRIIAVKE